MRFISGILLLFCISFAAFAQNKGTERPNEILTNDFYDFININRILMWLGNNGALSHSPITAGSGLEWPAGSGKNLVFCEGLIIGGLLDGEPHISGSTYRHGLQAGSILPNGTSDDPNATRNRIYRAHRYDAAWLNQLPVNEKARILTDLRDWPVQQGAPWIDANGNGGYDPDPDAWARGELSDTPLLPGDDVFWFVSNDMDQRRSAELYGTIPMGLEFQTMVWASSGHPLLENVVFREHTIIHKGPSRVNELRIGAWEDADLGDAFDDLCGVDTTLGLTFAYNGYGHDWLYPVPPVTGILWLQTPVVPEPGSTARFGQGIRPDYANIPLSAYVHYINGDQVYQDPYLGSSVGAWQMMNYLTGYLHDGNPMIDPLTNLETRFTLAGDPVLGTGWVDGVASPPGDRRQLSGCGPFTLAPGDTQKVVFARLVASDGNNLLGVRALKNTARQLRDMYRHLPMGSAPPLFSSAIAHPSASSYELRVSGGPFPSGTTKVEGVLRSAGGAEMQRIALADDGSSGDGSAGDGVYGGMLNGNALAEGADLVVLTTDADGVKDWFVDSEIPLPGKVRVQLTDVFSDSPNFDRHVNPGDNVRIGLRIENRTSAAMGPWHLFIRDDSTGIADQSVRRLWTSTPAGQSLEPVYDQADPSTYFSFTIPPNTAAGTILTIPVTLISATHCLWQDTLRITVEEQVLPLTNGLLDHVQGRAYGSLGYSIIDASALTLHDYRVSIEGEDYETKTVHVENITLGTTMYRGAPLPGRPIHGGTLIDGWLLNFGNAVDGLIYWEDGFKLWSPTPVGGVFSEPSRAWFGIYENNLMIGEDFLFGSKLNAYDIFPVQLVFDRSNGQKAMCYLRGGSPTYGYQGYFDVPVRAYDVSDPSQPRQLMLGFSEQRSRASNDNVWMPTKDPNDREILYVFADDYADNAEAKFQQPINTEAVNLDLLYCVWAMRNDSIPMFEDGDTYTISTYVPVSKRDVYILSKPRTLAVEHSPTHPAAITLYPNYPNPFGAGSASGSSRTTISFDLPDESTIRLAVYDILGREVAVLAQGVHAPGTYRAQLDGAALPNGLYYCRLEAGAAQMTRCILLLR